MNRRNAFKMAIASVVGLVVAPKVVAKPVEDYWIPTNDEDAMVVYRLVRAPERRVFSVNVNVPPEKADEYMKRLKEQFAKKKLCRR